MAWKRDDDPAASRLGQPRRQREDLGRQARDVLGRADGWKPNGHCRRAVGRGLEPHFGPGGADGLAEPRQGPRHARLGRQHRLGIALEKRQVGAVAADGGLDREAPGTLGVGQRPPDERRLAVAPWRDEEHFLPGEQVGRQALELVVTVDEGRLRDDLAVDERVLHVLQLRKCCALRDLT